MTDKINQFEGEQKMLTELKDLFQFVPPKVLRRNLEDLYFLYMSSTDEPNLPSQKEFVTNFYYLINFLNEMEKLIKK